jgi:endonuclease YncB( thermonuclease family)
MSEPNFQNAIDFATGLVMLVIIGVLALLTIAAEFVDGAEPRKTPHSFEYPLRDVRVVDGDTLEATAYQGLHTSRTIMIRLAEVDAYELRDKPRGPAAKAFVIAWVAEAKSVTVGIINDEQDKYGRYIGYVHDDRHRPLHTALLDAGHAVPYPRAK